MIDLFFPIYICPVTQQIGSFYPIRLISYPFNISGSIRKFVVRKRWGFFYNILVLHLKYTKIFKPLLTYKIKIHLSSCYPFLILSGISIFL